MADPIRWQDVIKLSSRTIDGSPAATKQAEQDMQRIIPVLERLQNTEAGQKMLRQMQHQMKNQGEEKLYIGFDRDYLGNQTFMPVRNGCRVVQSVNINLTLIDSLQYKGTDGQYHDYDINHWVIHELVGHAAMANANEQDAVTYTNRILGPEGMNITVMENGKEIPFPKRGNYDDTRIKPGSSQSPDWKPVDPETKKQRTEKRLKEEEVEKSILPCGEKEPYKMAAKQEGNRLNEFAATYYQSPGTSRPSSKPGRELN